MNRIWIMAFVVAAACPLGAAEKTITQITWSGPAVSQPRSTTGNRAACYGLGFPVQVGPKKAALFCNLRVVYDGDYEDGADVYLFDSLKTIGEGQPLPMVRPGSSIIRGSFLADGRSGDHARHGPRSSLFRAHFPLRSRQGARS